MGEGILNRQTELILVFDKNNAISRKFDKNNFERGTLNDIWLIKRGAKSKELKNHSAIFPEALVEKILINFLMKVIWFTIRLQEVEQRGLLQEN